MTKKKKNKFLILNPYLGVNQNIIQSCSMLEESRPAFAPFLLGKILNNQNFCQILISEEVYPTLYYPTITIIFYKNSSYIFSASVVLLFFQRTIFFVYFQCIKKKHSNPNVIQEALEAHRVKCTN